VGAVRHPKRGMFPTACRLVPFTWAPGLPLNRCGRIVWSAACSRYAVTFWTRFCQCLSPIPPLRLQQELLLKRQRQRQRRQLRRFPRVMPVMPAMPVTNANSASASPPAATPTRSHSPPFRRNLLLILASAVVLVVCALAWQRWHSPKQARVDHAMAARKSIAVLPRTDLNDKPSPWFAKAVTRDLRSWCIFAAPMRLN